MLSTIISLLLLQIIKGEECYKNAGMTFKAGLLFHGYPGCGKTSTIKGILKSTLKLKCKEIKHKNN